jgi:hypothetical protein
MAVVAITATTLTTLKYYSKNDDNNASDYESYDDYDFSTESHHRHSPKFHHNRQVVQHNEMPNFNDKHVVKRSSDEESIAQYAIDDDNRNSSMSDEAKRNKVKEV